MLVYNMQSARTKIAHAVVAYGTTVLAHARTLDTDTIQVLNMRHANTSAQHATR